jgi:hypothetical protein
MHQLLGHAGLSIDADKLIAFYHACALRMLMAGEPITTEFAQAQVTTWQDAAQICSVLLRAGLIRAGKGGFHFAFPQLLQISLQHAWLPNLLAMLDSKHDFRIVTTTQALAGTQDEWVTTFLPTLVEAVEADQLSPPLILNAIHTLSKLMLYRYREDVELLIYRINVAWRRYAPGDSQRDECVRAIQFHLRRHAPPRLHKPAAQVLSELTEHLTRAEDLLDRTALWTAVQLADMTGHGCALRLINRFFDVHPAFQADLLIGCLKADTQRSFEHFLALLRRRAFVSHSSAGYVATVFPLWRDQFSISLLQAFVESGVVNDHDPAHHFAKQVMTCLHNQSA